MKFNYLFFLSTEKVHRNIGIHVPASTTAGTAIGGPSYLFLSTEVTSPMTVDYIEFHMPGPGYLNLLVTHYLLDRLPSF